MARKLWLLIDFFLSHQFYIVQTSYIKLSNLSTARSSPESTYQSKQTIADHSTNSKTPFHCALSFKLRLPSLEPSISTRLKSTLRQESLSLYHFTSKLDQENSLSRPHVALSDGMCRYPCGEVCAVTYPFYNSSHKGGAVQLAHFAGYANVLVDKRLVVDNHVLVRLLCIRRLFQPVRLSAKEMLPYVLFDEVEEGNYVLGPQLRPNRFTVKEEIEKFDAYRVALNVESRVVAWQR